MPRSGAGQESGGVDDCVAVDVVDRSGGVMQDVHPHAVLVLLGCDDARGAAQEQPPVAGHPFGVLAGVEIFDQREVDGRVVGAAVVVDELPAHTGIGGVEVVDGVGVEHPVGERAVVGRAVPVLGEDAVHLDRRRHVVQVGGDLGGALAGTHDDEPVVAARRQPFQVVQEAVVVDLAGRAGDAGRQLRRQTTGDDDVAGAKPAGVGAGDIDVERAVRPRGWR